MKPNIAWTPVLQPLTLSEYNPAASKEGAFQVCVNPPRGFTEERTELVREFVRRNNEYKRAVEGGGAKSEDQARADVETIKAYSAWLDETFFPGLDDWFARLLSFGEDQFDAEEIAGIRRVDEHLFNWLTASCIRMIDDHRDARKKN